MSQLCKQESLFILIQQEKKLGEHSGAAATAHARAAGHILGWKEGRADRTQCLERKVSKDSWGVSSQVQGGSFSEQG
jgi:hypothetical protein